VNERAGRTLKNQRTRNFTATEGDAGARADIFLAKRLIEFSRSEIQRMKKNVANAHKLKPGDIIEIEIPIHNAQLEFSPPAARRSAAGAARPDLKSQKYFDKINFTKRARQDNADRRK